MPLTNEDSDTTQSEDTGPNKTKKSDVGSEDYSELKVFIREVTDQRQRLLASFAARCQRVAREISEKQVKKNNAFSRILRLANDHSIAVDREIATFGNSNRSNASRWMHEHEQRRAHPNLSVQQDVLEGISIVAQLRLENLKAGRDEAEGIVAFVEDWRKRYDERARAASRAREEGARACPRHQLQLLNHRAC
ncbi:MAG: hypothetical protein AAFR28_18445, partial [Pseudomonadota bacterium]